MYSFSMKILGIETSCDETGVAIYDTEQGLLAHTLYSQIDLHALYGGVVPELASRNHIQKLLPLVRECLTQAGVTETDIAGIAYTYAPGLIGALMIGAAFAKSLAYAWKIPTIPVHHMEGHLLAPFLEDQKPKLPFVALLVSGGHTQLLEVKAIGDYTLLGETLDDAAGEAFDKVAKLLGLPYPGGKYLAKLAETGTAKFKLLLPLANKRDSLDFSFSGLKSEFMRILVREAELVNHQNLAASYQKALFDHLESRLRNGLESTGCLNLAIVGGVAKNQELRSRLEGLKSEGLIANFWAAKPEYCTDNAAMIGMTGYLRWSQGFRSELSDDVRSTHRPKLKKLSRG